MKKLLLFIISLSFIFNCYSQIPNSKITVHGFKNGQKPIRNYSEAPQQQNASQYPIKRKFTVNNNSKIAAVSASPFTGSMNAFGVLVSESKPLQYNTAVNAITFIHRKSPFYIPNSNGNSGSIVGMYSTNKGTSWDSTCIWANATEFANNPQGGIYNPLGNTNINNAFMVGCGPLSNGSGWIGNWYASKQLTSPGTTTAGIDQQAHLDATPIIKKHSFSEYSFTAIDGGNVRSIANLVNDPNGITNVSYGLRGAAMVKGMFSAGAFTWSVDSFAPCVMSRADGSKYLNKTMIQAWDEVGVKGYVVMLGVRCGAPPCQKSYQPIVYKTTNGGASWSLLPGFDFASFKCVSDRIYPINTSSFAAIPYFSSDEGLDATVDINGNLHLVSTVVGAYSFHNDSLDYVHSFGAQKYSYSYGGGFEYPAIYDVYTNTLGNWYCHLVDTMGTEGPSGIIGAPGYTTNPWLDGMGQKLDLNARIQVSRTSDGKKIFYTWTESDTAVGGLKWNIYPDIKIKGFDMTLNKLTPRYNMTKGITNADQQSYFHYVSPRVISTGTTSFEIPITVSFNGSTDGSSVTDHFYLKGASLSSNSFSLNALFSFASGPFSYCSTLNTDENIKQSNFFNYYPNPTSGQISISYISEKSQIIKINTFDISGRKLFEKEIKCERGVNNFEIDLEEYKSGLYFLVFSTNSFTETKKIIKE